jgi:type VI secretion system protein ImpC
LNISQQDLEDDFEHSISVFETVLYKKMYLEEFGQFGGDPYGALILDYPMGKTAKNFSLLKNLGQVAHLCHVPVIAQADPSFFGVSSFAELSRLRDLKLLLETHRRYSKWRTLRKGEEARYLGLTLPGFVIRYPYDYRTDTIESFSFIEEGEPLWGNSVFAFASCLLASFVKHRLCLDIIGPQGGNVAFLENRRKVNSSKNNNYLQAKILVSEKLEEVLTDAGFISLISHTAECKTMFHSACSIKLWQLPKSKKKKTGFDELLSSQLPYTFLVSRIAHYIKIIQRDKIGSWQNAKQIEEELNAWLRQYVSEMENPSPEVIAKRPLRFAHVSVTEQSSADWYDMNLELIPHLKFMGASFSLSLQGILDRRSNLREA